MMRSRIWLSLSRPASMAATAPAISNPIAIQAGLTGWGMLHSLFRIGSSLKA